MSDQITVDAIRRARERLKAWEVKPFYPSAHPTCCKGNRTRGQHSPYCFTLKGYYVMQAHAGAIPRRVLRKARRRSIPNSAIPELLFRPGTEAHAV